MDRARRSPSSATPERGRDLPGVFAVSDLHVTEAENRALVEEELHPSCPDDWLIVAGDVSHRIVDVEWTLGLLAERFRRVFWVPGNHELWSGRDDADGLGGERRYQRLVTLCRNFGVLTPEDLYVRWEGRGTPAIVAPTFTLYDYSFRAPGTTTKDESLAYAYRTGIVCSDEFLLRPDGFPSIEDWCAERVRVTEERLEACGTDVPIVVVNHYPLVRQPTAILRYPEFAQWCGTERTADWHRRFPVQCVVYGHLHTPGTYWYDGVRFEEVSWGYAAERAHRPPSLGLMRRVLPWED